MMTSFGLQMNLTNEQYCFIQAYNLHIKLNREKSEVKCLTYTNILLSLMKSSTALMLPNIILITRKKKTPTLISKINKNGVK